MTPKLTNFTIHIWSNSPRKSMPKLGLILNSNWSKDKLKGQTLMKICESNIHGNLIELKNPMKVNSLELDLRSGRNLCLEISKNLLRNLGEKEEILILKL